MSQYEDILKDLDLDNNTKLSDAEKDTIANLVYNNQDSNLNKSFWESVVTVFEDKSLSETNKLVVSQSKIDNPDVKISYAQDGNQVEITVEDKSEVSYKLTQSNVDLDMTKATKSTVTIDGDVTKDDVSTGTGNDTIEMTKTAQENAEVTVDTGDGFDVLVLQGKVANGHTFDHDNTGFKMHSADVTLNGVDVVVTDLTGDGVTTDDHITVLATDANDALIAKLYKVALGREAVDGRDGINPDPEAKYDVDDPLTGINFWMNEYEQGKDTTNPEYTHQLVRAFLNCDEFHNKYDGMTNEQYVAALFDNAGMNNAIMEKGYVEKLKSGDMDRADVAQDIAESANTVKVLGTDGIQYLVDGYSDDNA